MTKCGLEYDHRMFLNPALLLLDMLFWTRLLLFAAGMVYMMYSNEQTDALERQDTALKRRFALRTTIDAPQRRYENNFDNIHAPKFHDRCKQFGESG